MTYLNRQIQVCIVCQSDHADSCKKVLNSQKQVRCAINSHEAAWGFDRCHLGYSMYSACIWNSFAVMTEANVHGQ